MIAEALDISRETYFAILLDRQYDGPGIKFESSIKLRL